MIDVQSARNLVLRACEELRSFQLHTEDVPLALAHRRVLAEPILLDQDQPPFDRSMRDGYALRTNAESALPLELKVVGEVRAGEWPSFVLNPGEAAQIMTGAPVPDGADGVVMVEYTQKGSTNCVRILRPVRRGENISFKGSEGKTGNLAIRPGRRISWSELAVLAAVGKSRIRVYQAPTVGILPTGDELVGVEEYPLPGQIRETNSYILFSQVLDCGAQPRILSPARDNLKSLRTQIELGFEMDVLLISGGVSAGKYDLVKQVLAETGARIHFESVSIRPGRPTVFLTLGQKLIFGLPGNPVSTFVTFELFVRPVLECLEGLPFGLLPTLQGILVKELHDKSERTSFLPARVTSRKEGLEVLPLAWKGSADIFNLIGANGFVIVPQSVTCLQSGRQVEVLMFSDLNYA